MSRARSLVAALFALATTVVGGSAAATEPAPDRPLPGPGEDYVLHCSGCHGPGGQGAGDVVPSFEDLGRLVATPSGRDYLARVPGVAQAPLSDARLARLLNWLVERHSGAAPDPRYDALEVSRHRQTPLRDPIEYRKTLDVEGEDRS